MVEFVPGVFYSQWTFGIFVPSHSDFLDTPLTQSNIKRLECNTFWRRNQPLRLRSSSIWKSFNTSRAYSPHCVNLWFFSRVFICFSSLYLWESYCFIPRDACNLSQFICFFLFHLFFSLHTETITCRGNFKLAQSRTERNGPKSTRAMHQTTSRLLFYY